MQGRVKVFSPENTAGVSQASHASILLVQSNQSVLKPGWKCLCNLQDLKIKSLIVEHNI